MRSIAIFVLLCVLPVLGACASAAGQNPQSVGEADNGKNVTLSVGQELHIALPANPTTGFIWQVTQQPFCLAQGASPKYVPSEAQGRVGAGGVAQWVFKAASAGAGKVTLVYLRPWETGAAPAKSVTYSITVR